MYFIYPSWLTFEASVVRISERVDSEESSQLDFTLETLKWFFKLHNLLVEDSTVCYKPYSSAELEASAVREFKSESIDVKGEDES